jgi:hypothetical protein
MAATDTTGPPWTSSPDPDAHERIARLSATLCLRPDAEHVRQRLAAAFTAHTDDLWPAGDPNATAEWIAANVVSMLATLERLFSAAAETDTLGAAEFLDRMAWLPPLLDDLDQSVPLDG